VTDPTNNTTNPLPLDKRNKVIEAIYRFDYDKLRTLANDDTLINVCIQDNGLSLLHLVTNLNPVSVASKTNRQINDIDTQIKAIVIIMLDKGYIPNIRDNHGRTPLHYAASQGNNSVIKILIEQTNQDINPLTIGRETPLMKSLYFGRNASAKLLLSYCKDFTLKNQSKKNSLDIARSMRNEEMTETLEYLYKRYRSRLLWLFITNFDYCKVNIPYQSKLELKQKKEVLNLL